MPKSEQDELESEMLCRAQDLYLIAAQMAQDVAQPENAGIWILRAAGLLVALFFIVALTIFLLTGRHWMRAFVSGAGVSILDIIGMQFRKINPTIILNEGSFKATKIPIHGFHE